MFKLFTQSNKLSDSAARIPVSGSDVRGATGLSRELLRRHVSLNGLFGRDSALQGIEQAVVQSVLGAVPQIEAGAVLDLKSGLGTVWTTHLRALRAFARSAVEGGGTVSRAEWALAGDAGLSVAKRAEVQAVVALLKETFGLDRSASGGLGKSEAVANAVFSKAA